MKVKKVKKGLLELNFWNTNRMLPFKERGKYIPSMCIHKHTYTCTRPCETTTMSIAIYFWTMEINIFSTCHM